MRETVAKRERKPWVGSISPCCLCYPRSLDCSILDPIHFQEVNSTVALGGFEVQPIFHSLPSVLFLSLALYPLAELFMLPSDSYCHYSLSLDSLTQFSSHSRVHFYSYSLLRSSQDSDGQVTSSRTNFQNHICRFQISFINDPLSY